MLARGRRPRRRAARPRSSRSGTRSTPITRSIPRCCAIRQAMSPIGPRPSTTTRAAVGHVGVLDGLPRRGQHVGEVDEAVVRRALGHLDRAVVGLRHPQVLRLAAGHLAVELGVAEQRRAHALLADLGRLALGLQSRWSHMKQCPQEMLNGTTTRSPTARSVTSAPTSSTMPIGSWPRMSPGVMKGPSTSYRWRSEPQMPVEVIRTIASVGFLDRRVGHRLHASPCDGPAR